MPRRGKAPLYGLREIPLGGSTFWRMATEQEQMRLQQAAYAHGRRERVKLVTRRRTERDPETGEAVTGVRIWRIS